MFNFDSQLFQSSFALCNQPLDVNLSDQMSDVRLMSVVPHTRPSGYFQMGDLFAVCNPPVGPYDAECPQILWRTTTYKNKAYLLASIPVNRVPDFIKGEELRGHCLYIGKPRDIPNNQASTFFCDLKTSLCSPITFCKLHVQSKASLGVPGQLSEGCSAIANTLPLQLWTRGSEQ